MWFCVCQALKVSERLQRLGHFYRWAQGDLRDENGGEEDYLNMNSFQGHCSANELGAKTIVCLCAF